MARPVTDKQRREALILAANEWIKAHGGQSSGARAAKVRGTPIKQQSLGWAAKGEKLGPRLAEELAALYDTTPDGLVRYLLGEGSDEVPLRDVPGWARAKQEAMERFGHLADDWTWRAVDHVILPFAPGHATPEMVLDFAQLLAKLRGSGTRARLHSEG